MEPGNYEMEWAEEAPLECILLKLSEDVVAQIESGARPALSIQFGRPGLKEEEPTKLTIDDVVHNVKVSLEPHPVDVYSQIPGTTSLMEMGYAKRKAILQQALGGRHSEKLRKEYDVKEREKEDHTSMLLSPRAMLQAEKDRGRKRRASQSVVEPPAKRARPAPAPASGRAMPAIVRPTATPASRTPAAKAEPRAASVPAAKAGGLSTPEARPTIALSPKEELIHILAIKPASASSAKGSMINKSLATNATKILSEIADFRPPGLYHLHNNMFQLVRIDKYPYSGDDVVRVRTRMQEAFDTLSLPPGAPERKLMKLEPLRMAPRSAAPSPAPSPVPSPAPSPAGPRGAGARDSDGPRAAPKATAKLDNRLAGVSARKPRTSASNTREEERFGIKIPPFPSADGRNVIGTLDAVPADSEEPSFDGKPAIASHDQYQRFKAEFKNKYKVYHQLDLELSQNAATFDQLGKRLADSKNDRDTQEVSNFISELYDRREETKKRMNYLYKKLHLELKSLKLRVAEFVELSEKSKT